MNTDMKNRIINLLETYPERQRQIALLHYELEHPAQTSESEMLRAMALGTETAAVDSGEGISPIGPSISPSRN